MIPGYYVGLEEIEDTNDIDNLQTVSKKVLNFYASLNQWTTDLFPDLQKLNMQRQEYYSSVEMIIEHLVSSVLKRKHAKAL